MPRKGQQVQYLTLEQAAKVAGMSVAHLNLLCICGDLRYVGEWRGKRVTRASVERLTKRKASEPIGVGI